MLGNVWCWQSVDESIQKSVGVAAIKELSNQFDLCVTGEVNFSVVNNYVYFKNQQGMMYLTTTDVMFKRILPHVKVFARVSPKQKVEIM